MQVRGRSALPVDAFQIKKRLAPIHTRIEIAVRPDDLRDLPEWRIGRKTKPEGREILLCDILAYPRTEIGKQVAQFLPPLPPRRNHAVALQKQSKVDRKSTRLNSSHTVISYAVFCLKKKK